MPAKFQTSLQPLSGTSTDPHSQSEHAASKAGSGNPSRQQPVCHSASVACRALCVGVGAGTLPNFLSHHFPGLQVDAVDLDPLVINAATEYMGLPTSRCSNISCCVTHLLNYTVSLCCTSVHQVCAVLCSSVLCCAVLCCAVLCCAVLCCAVLCCAALRCALASHKQIRCRQLFCCFAPLLTASIMQLAVSKEKTSYNVWCHNRSL